MYEVIVDISRRLRKMGVRTSVSESIDACVAVSLMGNEDADKIKTAIKVTMIKDPSKYSTFEDLFMDALTSSLGGDNKGEEGEGEGGDRGSLGRQHPLQHEQGGMHDQSKNNMGLVMYSPMEVLTKRNIKPIDIEKLREGKRIIKRLRRRLAVLPGRRWQQSKRGEIDFIKSYRRSLSTLGELLELKRSRRIIARARLVAFIDISGSMDSYTDWLVRAMYLLRRFARRVEIFVFSTRLMRITDILSSSSTEEISRRLYERVDLWGSGTRIGHCLKSFIDNFGTYVDRTWVALIISDGWDTGEPELLRRSMEALKRSCGRIIWLNPHADKPNFRPMTIGMLTALPYIDILAGTSVLEDYRSFIKFFGNSIKPIKNNTITPLVRR